VDGYSDWQAYHFDPRISLMAHRISFFPYSEWDSDRGCMAFIVLVDGVRARCLIRAEALVELAQENAASPILTFSEHRDAVQALARDLIERGRLDGAELVIRMVDVQECRREAEPREEPAASAPESTPVPTPPVDGRQLTMADEARQAEWRLLCERQAAAGSRVSQQASPPLAARVQGETEAFREQPLPDSAHELNIRRVQASRMTASWRTALSQESRTAQVRV
jgi:hypothetical protein